MNRSLPILTFVAISVGLVGCYSETKTDESSKVENTTSKPSGAAPKAKPVVDSAEKVPTWIVYTLPG